MAHHKVDAPLQIRGQLLARNSALNLVGLGLPLVVGVITVPIIIHWLGDDRFGIMSLVWVVFGYFGIFDFGLGTASTKFIAEALGKGEHDRVPQFLWTAVFSQTALGTIAAVILSGLTPLLVSSILKVPPALHGEARTSFYLLALALPFVFAAATFRGALEAGQRFDLVNVVKIPSSAANYLLPLLGIPLKLQLPGIVALFIGARVATVIVWIILCRKTYPSAFEHIGFHRQASRPLFAFGGWVTATNFLWPLFAYLDRIFIGARLSLEAVSYYSAPYEGVMRLGIIPGSLMATLFPAFSTLKGTQELERARTFFSRSLKFLLLVLGPVVGFLIYFAGDLLRLWLGENYAQNSVGAVRLLALAYFVNGMASAPFALLQSSGRADLTAKFYAMEFIVYAPLCWVMIPKLGISGAALALLIRGCLDLGLLMAAAIRLEKLRVSDFSRARVLKTLFLLVCFFAAGTAVFSQGWGIIGFAVVMAGFVVPAWRLALDEGERRWATRRCLAIRGVLSGLVHGRTP